VIFQFKTRKIRKDYMINKSKWIRETDHVIRQQKWLTNKSKKEWNLQREKDLNFSSPARLLYWLVFPSTRLLYWLVFPSMVVISHPLFGYLIFFGRIFLSYSIYLVMVPFMIDYRDVNLCIITRNDSIITLVHNGTIYDMYWL
jgi:hypothetical protein